MPSVAESRRTLFNSAALVIALRQNLGERHGEFLASTFTRADLAQSRRAAQQGLVESLSLLEAGLDGDLERRRHMALADDVAGSWSAARPAGRAGCPSVTLLLVLNSFRPRPSRRILDFPDSPRPPIRTGLSRLVPAAGW